MERENLTTDGSVHGVKSDYPLVSEMSVYRVMLNVLPTEDSVFNAVEHGVWRVSSWENGGYVYGIVVKLLLKVEREEPNYLYHHYSFGSAVTLRGEQVIQRITVVSVVEVVAFMLDVGEASVINFSLDYSNPTVIFDFVEVRISRS